MAGQEYQGSIMVSRQGAQRWEVTHFEEITEASLSAVMVDAEVEILVVGSGTRQEFFAPALRQRLKERGVAVECMDTGAACRTYNILLQEDRKVAAALIAV